MARRPGFALVAVVTIGVGIGALTVAFTGINAILYRGLLAARDVPGAGRVYVDDRGANEGEASRLEYQAFTRDVPSLEISATARITLGHRGEGRMSELVFALAVTRNHFALLGITAALGRTFDRGEDQLSVIVSDRFWRERLNGAGLAGLTVDLNGIDVPVLGVLPADAQDGLYDPSVWVRIEDWDALQLAGGRGAASFNVFGRLRPGASAAQANSQLTAVSRELARAWPATNTHRVASFRSFGDSAELRALERGATAAMAMIAIVLLIALFNLVGLMLARAVDREREMSLRGALGASRARLVTQLLVESLIITSLGGAAALVVARFSGVFLRSFAMQSPIPMRVELTVDWRVAAFTAALVTLCGLIAGLLPARRATRLGVTAVLTPSGVAGGRHSRLRNAIVGAQLAGATLLLVLAALLVRNAMLAAGADVGFEPERAVLVTLYPANHGYSAAASERVIAGVLERMRATPGVVAAAVTDRVPFYVGYRWTMAVALPGGCQTADCPEVSGYRVGPAYFRAMNIPVRAGREFDGSAADRRSVMISELMARTYWPSRPPVGEWVTLGGERRQVIGVAADVVHRALGERPLPYVYLPFDADGFAAPVTLVARTAAGPAPLVPAMRAHVAAVDPGLPVMGVQTMADHLDARARAGTRIVARFFLVCGMLGLFLATVGLGGSVAYGVRQRTRELGIRAAIGATPAALGRLVVSGALQVALAGITVGLLGALAATSVISARASGLDLDSPLTLALTAVGLLLLVLAAAFVPGRQAARVSPLAALRSE